MRCEWCGHEIDTWYLKYEGKAFCRDNDDKCLKEYLYEKSDATLEMVGDDAWDEDAKMESNPWGRKD